MLHKFSMNGINILMDILSGAVHAVDDVAYDIADIYPDEGVDALCERFSDKYSREQIEEAVGELEELKEAGLLYTEDEYEQVLEQVKNRAPVVKALCLHVAHDCNLKCKYCFAEEGEYHGKRSLMSTEVGKKAIDFIIANSGNRRNLEVDFFGGEPLMNFEVVKEIVEYGREQEKLNGKNFRFTITTNGVLLDDEKQKYINENMHNVVLSLDGRKEINDFMRPRAGGQGSYDLIVPKFQKLADSRNQTDYYVRGTFTHHNLDFSKDIFHFADDLGFKQVSVEPVVADSTEDYAIQEEDLETIYKEYEKIAEELYIRHKTGEKDFNFFHFMVDLTGGPCVAKRLSGCGSGTEYMAVSPEGDLYPCHQFVGQPEFKLGTVFEGIKNNEIREEFANCNVYTKPDCKKCWAKFYCSGGCMANASHYAGSIMGTYDIGCKLQRKRLECAIMIKAKLMLDEAEK